MRPKYKWEFILKTDIEIAREAEPKKINVIADQLGISDEYLELYGKYKC